MQSGILVYEFHLFYVLLIIFFICYMAGPIHKLSLFWKELKRRNVHRSLAIYLGTSFIILEASDIIFPRWGLPDWTIDVVLYLLILGAVVTIIVSWIYDLTPKGVEKTKPLSEIQVGEQLVVRYGWKIATFVSLTVIVGLIIFNLAGGFKIMKEGLVQSLVILPFDNLTGDGELDFFVSGMHASLIWDMGQISGLRIIPKTSSRAYKNVEMSVRDITSELGVDAALEGTVMSLGDSIRILFKLISTVPEEKQLWVKEYWEERTQILNLYHQVTKQIAKEVRIELTTSEELLLAESRIINNDAYDAYLKGIYYLDHLSPGSLRKAEEYFNISIEKTPDWASPYEGLAMVWARRAQSGIVSPSITRSKSEAFFNKAIELDPDLIDQHAANARRAVWSEWNWGKAEKEFLKALAINPGDVMSRIWYAHFLMIVQRSNEAVSQGHLAVELDPLNAFVMALYALVLKGAGEYKVAYEYAEKATKIDPENYFAASILNGLVFYFGDYNKAFENQDPDIKKILEESGHLAALQEITARLEQKSESESEYVSPYFLANSNYQIKKYDRTLDWLEKAFEIHDPNIPYIIADRAGFGELYEHPRFIAILEKMGLPLPIN